MGRLKKRQTVYISETNFQVIDAIVDKEESNDVAQAEETFTWAEGKFTSALAWVECAGEYLKQAKFTHAGVAYMLAAAISIEKGKRYDANRNYTKASVCFFKTSDRGRAEQCKTKANSYSVVRL